jgi:hypothetical protein
MIDVSIRWRRTCLGDPAATVESVHRLVSQVLIRREPAHGGAVAGREQTGERLAPLP